MIRNQIINKIIMITKFSIQKILVYVALTAAALTFIYPFIWMIGASLAPEHELGKMTVWPENPGLGNFKAMLLKIPIGRSLINSLVVAVFTTSLVMITGLINPPSSKYIRSMQVTLELPSVSVKGLR